MLPGKQECYVEGGVLPVFKIDGTVNLVEVTPLLLKDHTVDVHAT